MSERKFWGVFSTGSGSGLEMGTSAPVPTRYSVSKKGVERSLTSEKTFHFLSPHNQTKWLRLYR